MRSLITRIKEKLAENKAKVILMTAVLAAFAISVLVGHISGAIILEGEEIPGEAFPL